MSEAARIQLFYDVELIGHVFALPAPDKGEVEMPWRYTERDVAADTPYAAVMRVVRGRWLEDANYFLYDGGAYFVGHQAYPRLELADGRSIEECAVRVPYDRLLLLNGAPASLGGQHG